MALLVIQSCKIDKINSMPCSSEELKSQAIRHFSKKHMNDELKVIAAKDSSGYYYIAISTKVPEVVRKGNYTELSTTGAWHYLYDKKTCKLFKLIREQ